MNLKISNTIKGLWSKTGFKIVLAIQTLIFVALIFNLFGHNDVYTYSFDGSEVIDNISLPAGTYKAVVRYSSDTNYGAELKLYDVNNNPFAVKQVENWLFDGITEDSFDVYVVSKSNAIRVELLRYKPTNVSLESITFVENNAYARMLLFWYVIVIILINFVWGFLEYRKQNGISKDTYIVAGVLIALTVLMCMPLMMDYYLNGADIGYHLLRVEGIKDSILGGQFPNRISPGWLQQHGYASPIYYCETLIYIEAFLRLIGFDVVASYRMFMVVITVFTVAIAYFSFNNVFNNKIAGLVSTIVYCTSFYRYGKTYEAGAYGECFAIMILPLFFYSFYRLYKDDINDNNYKFRFLPLTISYSILLQSHLLSTEQMGVCTIVLGIILFRRTFRIKTILEYIKAAILSALLSIWYLVPFVEYWLKEDVVIQNVSGRTIQNMGLYLAHHLVSFSNYGGQSIFYETGMYKSFSVGLGLILPFVLILFALIVYNKKELLAKEDRLTAYICITFALGATVMSLSIFPWDKIQFMSGITKMLVSSIQFPNRFLTISNVSVAALVGFCAKAILSEKKTTRRAIIISMAVISLVGYIYHVNMSLQEQTFSRSYNSQSMGSGYISGGEYLPYGASENLYRHDPIASEGVVVGEALRSPFGWDIYVENVSGQEGNIVLDFLYYHNYKAYSNQVELECEADENGEIRVVIPKEFSGNITVKYTVPFYWRIAEAISLISLIATIVLVYLSLKRRDYSDNCEFDELVADITNQTRIEGNNSKVFDVVIIVGAFALSSLPVFFQFISSGGEIMNTVGRIYAIAQNSILARLMPGNLDDFGNAANIIQYDICFILPALLIKAGISLTLAYKISLFIINLLTAIITLFAFKKISKLSTDVDNRLWVIAYVFYVLNPGRLSELYVSGSLNKACVYGVLPIIALGLMLYLKKKRSAWPVITLGISMTGLCSVSVMLKVVIIYLLFMLLTASKEKFVRRVLTYITTVIVAYMTNGFIYFELLYAFKDPYYVARSIPANLQGMGVYLSQYLMLFNGAGTSENYFENGLNHAKAYGPGLGIFVVIALFMICNKVSVKQKSLKLSLVILSLVAMVLSLNAFPYSLIQNKKYILSILLSVIGNPAEFGIIVSLILASLLIACTYSLKQDTRVNYILSKVSIALAFVPAFVFVWLLYKSESLISSEMFNTLPEVAYHFERVSESKLHMLTEGVSVIIFVLVLVFLAVAIITDKKKGKVDGK